MANNLGVLTLNLVARIGQFVEPMKNAERQTKTSAGNMQRDFEEADKGISMSAKNIGLSLAGVAASYVSLDRLINTQRTFDKLNAGLITATGSAEGAAAAFDSLQKFAKETPYGLEQSVGAFIKLTNLGLKPSEAALTSYGNTAAAMGKDLDQMIEAVADATTGEFERLKEFGIKASQENGKVSLTFKGQTTTIRNNAKEIEKYLLDLGNVDFAGAMQNRMKTLDGSIANLEDTIDGLFLKVSQSGIGDAIKAGVDGASESLETLGDNLDTVGDIALVVGAIFAGKYASSMISSIQQTVAASIEQKQALVAEQAESVKLIGIQAQRARQNVALALTEVNLARADFNNATTAAARAAATQRLTAANIALAISEKQASIATTAYTAATGAATVATSRLAAAKALLLGLTGGWVGLGITVASVAAGYLLMRGNGDQANKMLGDQSRYASLATGELEKLSGAQLRAAEKELSNQLMLQSGHLQKAKNDFEALTESVLDSNKGNQEAYRIWAELRTGVITTEQAFNKLNQAKFVTSDQINALADSQSKIIQHEGAVKKLNEQLNKTRESGANAANGIKAIGNAADETKVSIEVLNKALGKLTDQRTDSQYVMNTAKNLGGDIEKAKALLEYRKQLGLGSVGRQLTPQERKPFEDSYAALRALKAYEDNIAESKKTSLKLSKQQTSEYEKQAREASRIKEEQFKSREDIYYKYATREMKIEKDLQSEIAKIQGSNFSPKDTAGYISNAQSRSQLEVLLYKAQLDSELNDWKSTEQEKLNQKVYINELMIQLDADMNDKQKQLAMRSLIDRSNHELSWMRLQQQQRISDASEAFRTDMENIAARYAFEREQILLNKSISDEERKALLNASVYTQNKDESQVRDSAIADYRDVMGYEESPLVKQFEVLQKMRELDLINEEAYQNAKLQLQAKSTAGYMEGMLGGFASLVDENSKTYAVLFAAQKAFAVAQAMLNIPAAYSKAYDAVVGTPFVGPYIAPAVGAAAAALQVAQAASIKSVGLTGMAHDGIDNIPKEGTWLLDGGERVLNPNQNKDLTNYLSQAQQSNSSTSTPQNLQINNILDPSIVGDFMGTSSGTKTFMNFIKNNRSSIKAMIG